MPTSANFSPSSLWAYPNLGKIKTNLKILGFLAVWLTIPVFLASWWLSPQRLGQQAQIYQAESLNAPSNETTIPFKIKLKGVQAGKVGNQLIFLKGQNLQNQLSFTFNQLEVSQSATDQEVFTAKFNIDASLVGPNYTFWLKGPLHLQRRFDGIVINEGQELDFTAKPFLPGDLILPDTGQDDRVDTMDRDYLWSLLARQGKQPTPAEVKAADLDFDAKITSRDYSLLIDTGVGSGGEE